MPHVHAGRVLAAMRPYTEVLCLVRTSRSCVGLAKSDPYLSSAESLGEVDALRPLALREAIEGFRVGLVVLGLPLLGNGHSQTRFHRRHLAQVLARHKAWRPGVRYLAWDSQLSPDSALRECLTNMQWSAVGRLDEKPLSAGTQAAVALQNLLDEEMGGWPNTFA